MITNDAETTLRERAERTRTQTREAGEQARERLAETGASLRRRAEDSWAAGRASAKSLAARANDTLVERPFTAVALAFVAGLLTYQIGRSVQRRRR